MLSPPSVVNPTLVDPSVNFTQPLRELTLPLRYWPCRAPSTYVRRPPPATVPATVADVRPRAKRMRVCATLSEVQMVASTTDSAVNNKNFFIFPPFAVLD